jgi:hypothetical protein
MLRPADNAADERRDDLRAIGEAESDAGREAGLHEEAKRLRLTVSAILEQALTEWLGKQGCPSPSEPPAEEEPMTVGEAIRAFHHALRVPASVKDEVARGWLEYRSEEARKRAGNVVALRLAPRAG